jgi:hypothetical protein
MHHNRTTPLAIAAIVAATVLTALTLTIPQQAFAGGHHHNHNNNIKVDQQINQLNECSGSPPEPRLVSPGLTVCLNQADNNADIDK